MPDSEEEQAPNAPKRDDEVKVASAHNNPPNQPAEGGEVQRGEAEEAQKEC